MSQITGFKLIAALGVCAAVGFAAYDWWTFLPEQTRPSYVGSDRCFGCHQAEANAWRGSHHDLAMDVANDSTVRGDFDDATIEHFGITSSMYRDGQRYMVRTEGPDGELADFEVSHVFGYEPLQQYLVEIKPPTPGTEEGLGTLQTLPFCWDVENERWFYLSPPDVEGKLEADDLLHWTGYGQNWNHMCAACHSTDLKKNFDLETGSFATTYSDIDVGCEACHGPGSVHVQLAESSSLFWDRKRGKAITRFSDRTPHKEFHTCGPCHSHRRDVFPGQMAGSHFYDHYAHSMVEPELYYPDGQILSEVYVLGSYMQSKMYAKGIRCSACHDPHTARVKFDDNRLCTSCHQHPAARYDSPAHHQHAVGSAGSSCVACHMPETPYMMIDPRRDHSMKIPRPDLSMNLGVPNACTGCHLNADNVPELLRPQLRDYADWLRVAEREPTVQREVDRVNAWAADFYQRLYGDVREDSISDYAEILHQAWQDSPQAHASLPELAALAVSRQTPPIIRASALTAMGRLGPLDPKTVATATERLNDRDPAVRGTAAGLLTDAVSPAVIDTLAELLLDESRWVRIQAALALAPVPASRLRADQLTARSKALEDFRLNCEAHCDQAGSHMALANLAERTGKAQQAIQHYLDAIQAQPRVAGPRSNLANLLQRVGAAESAAKARAEELPLLARDAAAAPQIPVVQYRYAMALYLADRVDEAESVLVRALERHPQFAEARYFLALLYDKLNRNSEAIEQARALMDQSPDDPRYRELLRQVQPGDEGD